MLEPLAPADARKLISVIREVGRVAFSKHAREEMAKDGLTTLDVDSVLRGVSSIPRSARRDPGDTGSGQTG